MLDTLNRPASAPWKDLGKTITPKATADVWRKEAGLDYSVERSPVKFDVGDLSDGSVQFDGREVLYRSDDGRPLSVVSKGYKIVQPGDVVDFFAKVAEIGGFELEVLGELNGGNRIWGLAKVNEGAPVIGHDTVRPYLLLGTSYDGSMATHAKFTAIRSSCTNSIPMEVHIEGRAVSSLIRIAHNSVFDADKVRLGLGIVANVWDQWLIEARMLAEKPMTTSQGEVFATKLLQSLQPKDDPRRTPDVTKSRGFESIMSLFTGEAIGSDLTGGQSRWQMLNAITEDVDWHRGRSDNSRMASAWFGAGEALKNRAYRMLNSADQFDALEPA